VREIGVWAARALANAPVAIAVVPAQQQRTARMTLADGRLKRFDLWNINDNKLKVREAYVSLKKVVYPVFISAHNDA